MIPTAMPDSEYLALVKSGAVGTTRYGYGGSQRHFDFRDERWTAHYVAGFVSYPGTSRARYIPIVLTERGETALSEITSQSRIGS